MRAYNLAMLMVMINMGFIITNQFGIFSLSEYTGIAGAVFNFASNPAVAIGGVAGLIGLIALGSGMLSSSVMSDKGYAYTYFGVVFWGAFGLGSLIIAPVLVQAGVGFFYGIYTIICTLIFFMSVIQMPTGGAKGYV